MMDTRTFLAAADLALAAAAGERADHALADAADDTDDFLAAVVAAAPCYALGHRGAGAADAVADVLTPGWREHRCRITRNEAWRDAGEFLAWIEDTARQLTAAGNEAA